jgi:hypothetical protein
VTIRYTSGWADSTLHAMIGLLRSGISSDKSKLQTTQTVANRMIGSLCYWAATSLVTACISALLNDVVPEFVSVQIIAS